MKKLFIIIAAAAASAICSAQETPGQSPGLIEVLRGAELVSDFPSITFEKQPEIAECVITQTIENPGHAFRIVRTEIWIKARGEKVFSYYDGRMVLVEKKKWCETARWEKLVAEGTKTELLKH